MADTVGIGSYEALGCRGKCWEGSQ